MQTRDLSEHPHAKTTSARTEMRMPAACRYNGSALRPVTGRESQQTLCVFSSSGGHRLESLGRHEEQDDIGMHDALPLFAGLGYRRRFDTHRSFRRLSSTNRFLSEYGLLGAGQPLQQCYAAPAPRHGGNLIAEELGVV